MLAKAAEIGEGIVVAIVIELLERDKLKRRHEQRFPQINECSLAKAVQ